MTPRFLLTAMVASLALALTAPASHAQSLGKLVGNKIAADRSADKSGKNSKQSPGGDKGEPAAPKKAEPTGDRGEDVANLTPAQKAVRARLAELEKQFRMVDDAIAAHERRIRTVQSIRTPPGVRPPQVDPVPAELLQMRAGLWNAMQQAIRDSK